MSYDLRDMKQAALGTTVAILFIFVLRAGQPIAIKPINGILVGIVWLYITGIPFINKRQVILLSFVI